MMKFFRAWPSRPSERCFKVSTGLLSFEAGEAIYIFMYGEFEVFP